MVRMLNKDVVNFKVLVAEIGFSNPGNEFILDFFVGLRIVSNQI